MPKVSNWGKYGKQYCKGWEEEADLKAWVIGLVLGLFWQKFLLVFFEEPGNTDLQLKIALKISQPKNRQTLKFCNFQLKFSRKCYQQFSYIFVHLLAILL